MDKFAGLDGHTSSCTLGVVNPKGKHLSCQVIETNGEALVNVITGIPGKVHLCIEEGSQSSWLAEILSPHVAELVVVGLGQRRSKGQKNDQRDAFALADMLRNNDLESVVYKQVGPYGTLRQLVKVHTQIVRDVVRVKNRLRAIYRSRGVRSDKTIYHPNHRAAWLEQVPKSSRAAAGHLYDQLDALLPVRAAAEKDLVKEAHRHPISRLLETCPGFGPIRVAQVVATVVSPSRFRKRQQFWSYCGLGILMRSSADWRQLPDGSWQRVMVNTTRGLNHNHNHMLKAVFKGAATTVISLSPADEPLRQVYLRQTAAGTKPTMAKLTLARKLAALLLSMWKHQEVYDAKRIEVG
jgi:transposase